MRVGVVGTGGFARSAPLPAIVRCPETELLAVYDSDAVSASSAGAMFGARVVCSSLDHMLSLPGLDLVFVVSPPHTHLELLSRIITAKKHFICEKPAGVNSRDARSLAAQADGQGLLHAIDHEFRYDPTIGRLRQLIQSGFLGAPRSSSLTLVGDFAVNPQIHSMRYWSFHYSKQCGGGMLPHFASHLIDLHRFVFGGLEAAGGYAPTMIAEKLQAPSGPGDAPGPLRAVDVEDSAVLACRLPGGAPASIVGTFVAPCLPVLNWTMHGDKGALVFEGRNGWIGGGKLMGMRVGETQSTNYNAEDDPLTLSSDPPHYYRDLIIFMLQDIKTFLAGDKEAGRFATLHDEAAIWDLIEKWRDFSSGIA